MCVGTPWAFHYWVGKIIDQNWWGWGLISTLISIMVGSILPGTGKRAAAENGAVGLKVCEF